MSETIAAVVAGVFALAGAYVGSRAGRRQTADQATVEHGQWLRGQRQQAYLTFVNTWDTAVESFSGLQQSWESWVREYQEGDRLDDPAEASSQLIADAWREVRRDLERVELLGPQRVDFALRAMEDAFHGMQNAESGATCPYWDEWNPVLARASGARFNFHAAAIRTLRQPPSPEGEREGLAE